MAKCTCGMKTKLVCNPALALEFAKETIEELRARVASLEGALKEIDDKDTYSAKSYGPFAQIARRALGEK